LPAATAAAPRTNLLLNANATAALTVQVQHASGDVRATRTRVTVTLATTLTDANGPNAPQTGYNDATAADLSLTLSQPAPFLNSPRRQGRR